MSEPRKLGGLSTPPAPIRRINRLPILVALGLVVIFLAIVVYGLSARGLRFGAGDDFATTPGSRPASNLGDQLTQGVPDGIIAEPTPIVLQPTPMAPAVVRSDAVPNEPLLIEETTAEGLEAEAIWLARLGREEDEQVMRELQRQRMARLQADSAAHDSPIAVDIQRVANGTDEPSMPSTDVGTPFGASPSPTTAELYTTALQSGLMGAGEDPNGQGAKAAFFNQDIQDLGYLPNGVVAQQSPFELKRGSVIPATLITGVNSDLPGRITAQVSQNVFDSATGRHVLIPQGAKLLGRYDSDISFGQSRVLVIWTDVIFPNGSTLQIGGMAGTDSAGYGGFADEVDTHFFETFGSAILVALLGAGTELMLPQDEQASDFGNRAQSSARESFAETFSELSGQSVSRSMDVQPTLMIRPGYRFNVLVDQDMVFPGHF